MKQKLSVFIMMFALITMLSHAVIPHHEHEDKVCFEQIFCDDSEYGKETSKDQHACCLDKQEIVRTQNEDEHNLDCSHGDICDLHFPPILLFLGNFFESENSSDFAAKPYLNLYTSADIKSANPLRGPPKI